MKNFPSKLNWYKYILHAVQVPVFNSRTTVLFKLQKKFRLATIKLFASRTEKNKEFESVSFSYLDENVAFLLL